MEVQWDNRSTKGTFRNKGFYWTFDQTQVFTAEPKNQRGEHVVEHNVAIDDSLLPNAYELEKLKEIDTNIIPWILERAEQEQNYNRNNIFPASINTKSRPKVIPNKKTVAVFILQRFFIFTMWPRRDSNPQPSDP